jgi:hypothetical protein
MRRLTGSVLAALLALVVASPATSQVQNVAQSSAPVPGDTGCASFLGLLIVTETGNALRCESNAWTSVGPVFDVEAFGATPGNSGDDDLPSILAAKAAAEAAGGGVVYVPSGTFDITTVAGSSTATIPFDGSISFVGDASGSSTIRVKDGSDDYYCLLGSLSGSSDGVVIRDITFDHNIQGNERSTFTSSSTDARHSVCLRPTVSGEGSWVTRTKHINAASVNLIVVNRAEAVGPTHVTDNFAQYAPDPGMTGTHTGSGDAAVLTDSAASWTVDGWNGLGVVVNYSDRSYCTITDGDATTLTCTLANGDENDWDAGDQYYIYRDSSAIYVSTSGHAVITGNIVIGGTVTPHATTAIETHNSSTVVTGNTIEEMIVGVNLSGVNRFEDTVGSVCSNNTMTGVTKGIQVWSEKYGLCAGGASAGEFCQQDADCPASTCTPGHLSGYGMDGASMQGNVITVASRATMPYSRGRYGIRLISGDAGEQLDSRNITIAGNTVSMPSQIAVDTFTDSYGIGGYGAGGETLIGWKVTGNTVTGFPTPGILFSVVDGGDLSMLDSEITNNLLINPGSGTGTINDEYRTGIYLDLTAATNVVMTGNTVIDDQAASTLKYGYGVLLDGASTDMTNFVLRDNAVLLSGADQSSYIRRYNTEADVRSRVTEARTVGMGANEDVSILTVERLLTDWTFDWDDDLDQFQFAPALYAPLIRTDGTGGFVFDGSLGDITIGGETEGRVFDMDYGGANYIRASTPSGYWVFQTGGATSGENRVAIRDDALISEVEIHVGPLDTTCLWHNASRLFGDLNCDGAKDVGEEYLDNTGSTPGAGTVDASTLADGSTTGSADDCVKLATSTEDSDFYYGTCGSGSGIDEVEYQDQTGTLTGITQLRFDQADGFSISQPGVGVALIDIGTLPFANLAGFDETELEAKMSATNVIVQADIDTIDKLQAFLSGETIARHDAGSIPATAISGPLVNAQISETLILGPSSVVDKSALDMFIPASNSGAIPDVTQRNRFVADQEIYGTQPDTVQLEVRGASGQSGANIFEVRDSTGTSLYFSVGPEGEITFRPSAAPAISLVDNDEPSATAMQIGANCQLPYGDGFPDCDWSMKSTDNGVLETNIAVVAGGGLTISNISEFIVSGLSSDAALDLGTGVIGATELAASSVINTKIQDNAVTSTKIGPGEVANVDLGPDAVDGDKLADLAVDSEHIVVGALDPAHFSANSVDALALDETIDFSPTGIWDYGAGAGSGELIIAARTIAQLPTCDAAAEGKTFWVTNGDDDTDCTSGTSGSTRVLCTCNGNTNTWYAVGTPGAGGSGDEVSENGSAATDADFDDTTPAASVEAVGGDGINVKWQSTGTGPTDISAYVDYKAPLTVDTGELTVVDAGAGAKGAIQLAGDLGGTAALPSVNDNSHNHIYSNITPTDSTNWLTRITDAVGTGYAVFNNNPSFTGAITFPTPFTLGAVSVTATGTELNYVDGVTSDIQTQLNAKAPTADPDFTGLVELPNAVGDVAGVNAGDVAVDVAEDQFMVEMTGGGECTGECVLTPINSISVVTDPGAWYDTDTQIFIMTVGDEAPNGIIIDQARLACNTASPSPELAIDLKYADNFTALANATNIHASVDTSSGLFNDDTDANFNSGNAVANGKVIYLEFASDPEGTCTQMIFEMWYHAEED